MLRQRFFLLLVFFVGFVSAQPIIEIDVEAVQKTQPVVNPNTASKQTVTTKHLLLLSALKDDPALIATENILNEQGRTYRTLIATETSLTNDLLVKDGKGLYSGIILTEGALSFFDGQNWRSAFSADEWQTLWNYESNFGIRQVSLYSYPSSEPEDYGLRLVNPVDTTNVPLNIVSTRMGEAILDGTQQLKLENAYVYLSKLETSQTITAEAILNDNKGNIVGVLSTSGRRERIALTMSQGETLEHTQTLIKGLIKWLDYKTPTLSSLKPSQTSVNSAGLALTVASLGLMALILANWLRIRGRWRKRVVHTPQINL